MRRPADCDAVGAAYQGVNELNPYNLSDIPLLCKEGWPSDQNVRTRGRARSASPIGRSINSGSKEPRSAPYFVEVTNHPGCATKERHRFINGAATPPWKGGECRLIHEIQFIHSSYDRAFLADQRNKGGHRPRLQGNG